MTAKINDKSRALLIRKGNQLFNEGDISAAEKIFNTTNYKDGLIRIGDFYYNKGQPLKAIVYYRKASFTPRIKEMAEKMVPGLKTWLAEK